MRQAFDLFAGDDSGDTVELGELSRAVLAKEPPSLS
jgi:hypothetical protein